MHMTTTTTTTERCANETLRRVSASEGVQCTQMHTSRQYNLKRKCVRIVCSLHTRTQQFFWLFFASFHSDIGMACANSLTFFEIWYARRFLMIRPCGAARWRSTLDNQSHFDPIIQHYKAIQCKLCADKRACETGNKKKSQLNIGLNETERPNRAREISTSYRCTWWENWIRSDFIWFFG